MANEEISKIFSAIAYFLEAEGVQFKPYAYQRAALSLKSLDRDVREIYKEGGGRALLEIPGIGESMAEKIEEFLKTGKVGYLEKLKKKMPVNIEELTSVEGIGPKMVKVLYKKLDIKNLNDLERAAKTHKIAPLFGFGLKKEKNILEGIRFLRKSKGRFLLGEMLPLAREIEKRLLSLKEVEMLSVCGSLRRRKATIGDLDFLAVSSNPGRVMDFFVHFPDVIKVWGEGETKSSIKLKYGFDVDLRIVPRESFGSALQYFTGSKEHNIVTRKLAIGKGFKLNEYGLFKGKKKVAGSSEKEIYKLLGLSWIEPELREDRGEIEAALLGKLPKIISYKDIKGDLHTHSNWDGGKNSIWEMVSRAREMGYEYYGVSDHTKFLKIEHGLNEKQLALQRKEIGKLNRKLEKIGARFRILQGAETNILKSGKLDIGDKALAQLDYAVGGVHSNLKMSKEEMTERIIKAIKNPYLNIIAHPTGRILKKRPGYEVDIEKVFRAAKEFGVALEVNSSPERLDLSDVNIRLAKEMGVKMVIDTDSHQLSHLKNMELGISQARRGWAEKKDIINTWPLRKLLSFFARKKRV